MCPRIVGQSPGIASVLWWRCSTAGGVVLGGRIRTATLGESFLCSARVREHANQSVIALVTPSLIDLILLIAVSPQLLDGCPGSRPRRRILHRHLERERIRIDTSVAFDQMQVLSGSLEVRLLREIGDVHDQRIPLPPAKRISVPLADVVGQMRTVRDRDDPTEPLPLADIIVNRHSSRRLHNPRHTAEAPGLEQHRQAVSETALWSTTVLWAVGAIDAVQVVVRRALGSPR